MNLDEQLTGILTNNALDDEDSDLSKAEAIELLIEEVGWEEICRPLFNVLEDDTQSSNWRSIAEVIWGAVLDGQSLPENKVIALLFYRFDPKTSSEEDSNLMWSITTKLKKVDYLSDYEPLQDPAVIDELEQLQSK